ncbi:hypothetical protein SNEBB_002820 [Seison nebaliae]|nr:hypothetical protein SNEBB_002820 [Seison nebaliae]
MENHLKISLINSISINLLLLSTSHYLLYISAADNLTTDSSTPLEAFTIHDWITTEIVNISSIVQEASTDESHLTTDNFIEKLKISTNPFSIVQLNNKTSQLIDLYDQNSSNSHTTEKEGTNLFTDDTELTISTDNALTFYSESTGSSNKLIDQEWTSNMNDSNSTSGIDSLFYGNIWTTHSYEDSTLLSSNNIQDPLSTNIIEEQTTDSIIQSSSTKNRQYPTIITDEFDSTGDNTNENVSNYSTLEDEVYSTTIIENTGKMGPINEGEHSTGTYGEETTDIEKTSTSTQSTISYYQPFFQLTTTFPNKYDEDIFGYCSNRHYFTSYFMATYFESEIFAVDIIDDRPLIPEPEEIGLSFEDVHYMMQRLLNPKKYPLPTNRYQCKDLMCPSIDNIMNSFNRSSIKNIDNFKKICPTLLYARESSHCEGETKRYDYQGLTSIGTGFGLIIIYVLICKAFSFIPIILYKFSNQTRVRSLTLLQSLACGSLVANSLLFYIPIALGLQRNDHSNPNGYFLKSILIMASTIFFFLLERAMKLYLLVKSDNKIEHDKEHEEENTTYNLSRIIYKAWVRMNPQEKPHIYDNEIEMDDLSIRDTIVRTSEDEIVGNLSRRSKRMSRVNLFQEMKDVMKNYDTLKESAQKVLPVIETTIDKVLWEIDESSKSIVYEIFEYTFYCLPGDMTIFAKNNRKLEEVIRQIYSFRLGDYSKLDPQQKCNTMNIILNSHISKKHRLLQQILVMKTSNLVPEDGDMKPSKVTLDFLIHIQPMAGVVFLAECSKNILQGISIGSSVKFSAVSGAITTYCNTLDSVMTTISDFEQYEHNNVTPIQAVILSYISGIATFIGAVIGVLFIIYADEMSKWICLTRYES